MKKDEFVQEWLKYSYNDLFTAHHMFEDVNPKQTEISCFHCQQCAEKALKGFLIHKDIEPPRIHDIRILCKMCQDIDSSFNSISGFCADLTPFAVVARYPKELASDETVAKLAIDKAQAVYDFCVSKIRRGADDAAEGVNSSSVVSVPLWEIVKKRMSRRG